jgi:hypothetical protein
MRDEQGKLVRIARASGSVVPVPQYWKKDKPTHPGVCHFKRACIRLQRLLVSPAAFHSGKVF